MADRTAFTNLGKFCVTVSAVLALGGFASAARGQCAFNMLIADDASVSDGVGETVAISGDTAVIGAPNAFNAGDKTSGAVYVYVRSGDSWIQQATLAGDDAEITEFGRDVAIDGDTIVVGAESIFSGWTGAAHVFERSDGVWTKTATLKPDPLLVATTSSFGAPVAISGNTIVVGAQTDSQIVDGVSVSSCGAAYVFSKGDGRWFSMTSGVKLGASDAVFNYHFGVSVDVDDDRIVVGASGSSSKVGAAYVYDVVEGWSGTTTESARLAASDGVLSDVFGRVVAISGNTVIVGAHLDDNEKGTDKGAAYVFVESRGRWTQQQKLLSMNTGSSAFEFGHAVDVVGDVAVITEPWKNTLDPDFLVVIKGVAQVFRREGALWTGELVLAPIDPNFISDPEGVPAMAYDGGSIVVGSPSLDWGFTDAGAAFVVSGLDQDCDEDGVPDGCAIYSGLVIDADADGVPDDCVMTTPGDLDGDGLVGGGDLGLLLSAWGACGRCAACGADLNGDCVVDGADLGILLGLWSA